MTASIAILIFLFTFAWAEPEYKSNSMNSFNQMHVEKKRKKTLRFKENFRLTFEHPASFNFERPKIPGEKLTIVAFSEPGDLLDEPGGETNIRCSITVVKKIKYQPKKYRDGYSGDIVKPITSKFKIFGLDARLLYYKYGTAEAGWVSQYNIEIAKNDELALGECSRDLSNNGATKKNTSLKEAELKSISMQIFKSIKFRE